MKTIRNGILHLALIIGLSAVLVCIAGCSHNDNEKAAIDWMLEEGREPSVIQAEICDFVRGLVVKYRCLCERLESDLHEEEQWRGGWEDRASQTDGPRYDEMDEP